MPDTDPYHDRKPYHMAHLVSSRGHVSPLCAAQPRKLNLSREQWTLREEAVTCKKCLEKLKAKAEGEPRDADRNEA